MSIDQNGGRAKRDEQPNTEGVLQRKARGEGVDDMAVAHAGFGGQASEVPYRAEMEAGFGVDFGGVRAFSGGEAAEASRHLGAEAYTVGQNVAFADANPGKDVVAHELAHTIQQGGAPVSGGAVQTFGGEGAYEAEADDAAATVLAGGQAQVNMRTGASVQRWGGSDHYHIGNLAGQKALAKVRALGVKPKTKEVDIAHPDAPGTGQDGRRDIANPTKGETIDVNTGKTWGGLGSEGHISFGAATRYGGDYVTTADGLRAQTNEADLRLAHDNASMIGGAATNGNHFYPLNQVEYRGHHAKALAAARRGDMTTAMIEEGFANHFLADTFASGHVVPRALDSVEALHNEDPEVVFMAAATDGGFSNFLEYGWKGLQRSHHWHDAFCALEHGLPFSDGNRYHGDYYMDGTDLDRVSEVASESLSEVLAAGEGKEYHGNVRMVAPDFAAIAVDPVAGPMWRLMMKDYKADLDRARKAIGKDSKGRTDGGTAFSSKAVLNAMEADVFGAGKVVTPKNDLNTEREDLAKAFEAIEHYSNAQFNHNAALGPDGQNDDLEAPDEDKKNEKHWDAAALRDRGLLGGALEAAKAYKAAVVKASASNGAVAPEEMELANEAIEAATLMIENVPAWYSFASTVASYGRGKRKMRLLVPRIRAARAHAHVGESDLPLNSNAG